MSGALKPYPKYKESGVEWLGSVPEGWEVVPLKHCAVLQSEKRSEAEFRVALESIESYTGRLIETEIESDSNGITFEQGDILFGKLRPYLVKVWLADRDGESIGDIFVLRPVELVSPRYLAPLLREDKLIALLNGASCGSKMPRVGWDFMGGIGVPLPPLPEQQAIADYLDAETQRIDALIAELREMIRLLKEKRQALISRCVTKGLDPTVPMKDSGVEWMGDVPEGWEVIPLGTMVRFGSGGTPSTENERYWNGSVPWISPKDMKASRIQDSINRLTDLGVEDSGLERYPAGSALVVVRGMILAHSFPVAIAEVPVTVNQDMKAIVCGQRLCNQFLAWVLRGLKTIVLAKTDSSAHGTKKLPTAALTHFSIPTPPLAEQDKISAHLDTETAKIDRLISETEDTITLTQERRSALISSVVTGKLQVPGVPQPSGSTLSSHPKDLSRN
jgi:type I restriction enzyme S subunit